MNLTFSLTDLDDRQAFVKERAALHAQHRPRSFFQTDIFVGNWLQQSDKISLKVLRAAQGERVKLLAIIGMAAVGGIKKTVWLGESGDAALDALYPEYNDFSLADPNDQALRVQALEFLFSQLHGVDAIICRNATPELTAALQSAATTQQWTFSPFLMQHAWEIDLSVGPTVSSNTRKQIERSLKLYAERGELKVEQATADQFDSYWAQLSALHQQAWLGRNQPGAFANPVFNQFHQRLSHTNPDAVSLLKVSAGAYEIGYLYNFIHDKRVANYQAGFMYEDDNRLKPGLVAHYLAAEHYAQNGFEVYDLLAGDVRYKQSLATQATAMTSVELKRVSLRNKVIDLASSMKRLAKSVRAGTRQT